MPLIRKLIDLQTSKAVTVPKSWLDYYEKKYGYKITEVLMEIEGPKLIILLPEKPEPCES